MNMQLNHYRNYWMWINKITLPVFSVRACSNCWLQYQLIFWKPVTYYGINIASLSQDCITKVPDQHCTEQYQEPIINKYIWYINIYMIYKYIYIYIYIYIMITYLLHSKALFLAVIVIWFIFSNVLGFLISRIIKLVFIFFLFAWWVCSTLSFSWTCTCWRPLH